MIEIATVFRRYPDLDGPLKIRVVQFTDGRYHAVCCGYTSTSLDTVIAKVIAALDAEDARTDEDRQIDAAYEREAERKYQYGVDYACGIRD